MRALIIAAIVLAFMGGYLIGHTYAAEECVAVRVDEKTSTVWFDCDDDGKEDIQCVYWLRENGTIERMVCRGA